MIKQNIAKLNRIINRPLNENDIRRFGQLLPHFRGVFMRNRLPKPSNMEWQCGVINLDDMEGKGTHWVSYYRKNSMCYYFDSFGNLQPPQEFLHYIGADNNKCKIYYNHRAYQTYKKVNCGHLCMKFLYEMYLNENNKQSDSAI